MDKGFPSRMQKNTNQTRNQIKSMRNQIIQINKKKDSNFNRKMGKGYQQAIYRK